MNWEEIAPPTQSQPLQLALQVFWGHGGVHVNSMSRMTIYGRNSSSGSREVVGEVNFSGDLQQDGVIVSIREQRGDAHPLVLYELSEEEIHELENLDNQLAGECLLEQYGDDPSQW